MQRSSAALAQANNNLDESIALSVAMNNVIQNPEITGTALKTLSMYLRSAKVEAGDAGIEIDGMVSSTSKLQDNILKLTKGRVNIMLDDSTFKSTYQIIKEISDVWDSIKDVDQAALLEMLGGKRQANAIASLIKNFKEAEAAYETSKDSAGSAMEENAKYIDSIAGKMSQLQAAFQSLSTTILDSSAVKSFVDGLTSVTTVVDKLVSSIGVIPTLLGAGGIAGAIAGKGIVGGDKGKQIYAPYTRVAA